MNFLYTDTNMGHSDSDFILSHLEMTKTKQNKITKKSKSEKDKKNNQTTTAA